MDYSTGARDDGPVQFERQPENDPFDLVKRVDEVRGKKNPLDAIGSKGRVFEPSSTLLLVILSLMETEYPQRNGIVLDLGC